MELLALGSQQVQEVLDHPDHCCFELTTVQMSKVLPQEKKEQMDDRHLPYVGLKSGVSLCGLCNNHLSP